MNEWKEKEKSISMYCIDAGYKCKSNVRPMNAIAWKGSRKERQAKKQWEN